MMLTISLNLDTKEDPLLKDVEDTTLETIALCQRNSHNLNQQQREVGKWRLRHLKVCSGLKLGINSISIAFQPRELNSSDFNHCLVVPGVWLPKLLWGSARPLCSHKRFHILRFGCVAKLSKCVNTRCPCSVCTEKLCIPFCGIVDVSSFIISSIPHGWKRAWRTGGKPPGTQRKLEKVEEG